MTVTDEHWELLKQESLRQNQTCVLLDAATLDNDVLVVLYQVSHMSQGGRTLLEDRVVVGSRQGNLGHSNIVSTKWVEDAAVVSH